MSDPIHPASHDLSGPSPATPEQPALRASGVERERSADILRQAGGDGRIDVDELDQRLNEKRRRRERRRGRETDELHP